MLIAVEIQDASSLAQRGSSICLDLIHIPALLDQSWAIAGAGGCQRRGGILFACQLWSSGDWTRAKRQQG